MKSGKKRRQKNSNSNVQLGDGILIFSTFSDSLANLLNRYESDILFGHQEIGVLTNSRSSALAWQEMR